MKKTIVFAAVLFSGCNKTVNDVLHSFGLGGASASEEEPALKLESETRYYNDFLGVSYTIPKNWWLYTVNGDNFGDSKGDIDSEISMDLEFGEFETYSYTYAHLASFGNLEDAGQNNHLGFSLSSEFLEGGSGLDDFMAYFEPYMLEPSEESSYSLRDSQQITI